MDITRTFRACLSLFRIRAAEGLQYRLAALAGATTSIFYALTEILVYTVFFTYSQNAALAHGNMSLPQVVSYAWLSQLLFAMQLSSIDDGILNKIVSGDVAHELCRPMDLYAHWFTKTAAGHFSTLWMRGGLTFLVGLALPAGIGAGAPASPAGFLAFLVSVITGFMLCISYGMLITVIRMGITWGEGPTYILLLIGMVLSGGYLPLQLWPDAMQGFLLVQPFAGHLDIPARLYIGTMPPGEAIYAISLQTGWSAVFILAGRLLLRRKLRSIIIQGG